MGLQCGEITIMHFYPFDDIGQTKCEKCQNDRVWVKLGRFMEVKSWTCKFCGFTRFKEIKEIVKR